MEKIGYKEVSLLILFLMYTPLSAFGQAETVKALALNIVTELVDDLNGEVHNQETFNESQIIIEVYLSRPQNHDQIRTIIRNWRLKRGDIGINRDWYSAPSDYEFHTLMLYLKGRRQDTMIASLIIDFCDTRRWNCEGNEEMYKLKFTIGDLTL
jgi:hypothetical protein